MTDLRHPGVERSRPARGAVDAEWCVRRRGRELRVHYGRDDRHPQYAALHLDSSYLRLNHGPGAGWGTSLVLLPSFWSRGRLLQGAPVAATWSAEGPDLLLTVDGAIGGLVASIAVRLLAPGAGHLRARVAARVLGTVPVDERPGEAFKVVTLSSMRVSAASWDASAVHIGGRSLTIPQQGWIGHPAATARSLGLRGGTSAWKVGAPTIGVSLDRPFACAGWVTRSADPNDDNVGLWAGTDTTLSQWSYTVTASAEPRRAGDRTGS